MIGGMRVLPIKSIGKWQHCLRLTRIFFFLSRRRAQKGAEKVESTEHTEHAEKHMGLNPPRLFVTAVLENRQLSAPPFPSNLSAAHRAAGGFNCQGRNSSRASSARVFDVNRLLTKAIRSVILAVGLAI